MATYLGGSPLNLINLRSRPDLKTGKSTFPFDGNSITPNGYNSGASSNWKAEGMDSPAKAVVSIFSRPTDKPVRFTPWPSIKQSNNPSENSITDGLEPSRLHSDDLYDTSILQILKKTFGLQCELRAAHFAYLKDVGVYPNNRLMIARRFSSPSGSFSNLMRKGAPPLATMISWVPQDTESFFSIQFGEEWEEAEADFTSVLNDLGNDFMKSSGLGDKLGGGLGVIPLPGFTEFIQRKVLEKVGIMKEGASSYIPAGEPNLIKQAKKRKTGAYGQPFSGLKCSFSVKMVCEWEQKFLSGIDPTVVWLDIIQQVLRFGTSNSVTYGLSSGLEKTIMEFVNDPLSFVKKVLEKLGEVVGEFVKLVKTEVGKFTKALGPKEEVPADKQKALEASENDAQKKDLEQKISELATTMTNLLDTLMKRIIGKYKVRIAGILHSLVGSPSGPWHITLGNPFRPVFSSGDMIISDTVSLSFGSILAFNDLPSSIKAEFTLIPARNLGLQEIFARFNSGHLRSIMPYPNDNEKEVFARLLTKSFKSGAEEDKNTNVNLEEEKKNTDKFISEFYAKPEPTVGENINQKDMYRIDPPVTNASNNPNASNPNQAAPTGQTPSTTGLTPSTTGLTPSTTGLTPSTAGPPALISNATLNTANQINTPSSSQYGPIGPNTNTSPPVNSDANSKSTYITESSGPAASSDIQVNLKTAVTTTATTTATTPFNEPKK